MGEAIVARQLVDAEFRLRSTNCEPRWTNVRAAPVFDASVEIEKWAGINIDIDVVRLQKPVELRDFVKAGSGLGQSG